VVPPGEGQSDRPHPGRGIERGVEFVDATREAQAAIDDAYHVKYDRYGAAIVNSVVGPELAPVTLRLQPRNE
jgi:hypothetical protein